jgi:predicted nuclease of predicted toxin-antitoxin system
MDAAVLLRDQRHDCVHVGEVGMKNAADDEILAWSGIDSIVVTIDADFHAILAVSGAKGPSVIRLRIQGLRAPEVASRVARVLAEFEKDLQRGVLITVRPQKTACHRLPIGGD